MKLRHLLTLAALLAVFIPTLTAPLYSAVPVKMRAEINEQFNHAKELYQKGDYAGAEMEWREVLAGWERLGGAENPKTLAIRMNLASVILSQGKYAEAEQEYRAVLVVMERVLGKEHPKTLSNRNNLASALQAQGKNAEAEREFRVLLEQIAGDNQRTQDSAPLIPPNLKQQRPEAECKTDVSENNHRDEKTEGATEAAPIVRRFRSYRIAKPCDWRGKQCDAQQDRSHYLPSSALCRLPLEPSTTGQNQPRNERCDDDSYT